MHEWSLQIMTMRELPTNGMPCFRITSKTQLAEPLAHLNDVAGVAGIRNL